MEQQHASRGQERWEYHIEFVPTRMQGGQLGLLNAEYTEQLNRFGADGWELVSVTTGGSAAGQVGVSLIFKRRLWGQQGEQERQDDEDIPGLVHGA